MKERTTKIVLDTLKETGVRHVFGLTGGAIVNQLDAFSQDSDISFIPVQHEQAAAMAVDGYSRFKGYGAAMATSSPGGTNLVTGITGLYMDSIPGLFITGQVGRFDIRTNKVRQRGFQEMDMCAVMKPITKFSESVDDPEKVPEILGKAIKTSLEDRMGPVHIDLPIDIQQAEIETRKVDWRPKVEIKEMDMTRVKEMVSNADRPVLVVGNGVRLGKAEAELRELADRLQWPIIPSWGYADFQHENRIELAGVYGNRGANFSLANADLILAIGHRLDSRFTGSKPSNFAREAKKIIVDIDGQELFKGYVTPDLAIGCDAKSFILSMLKDMPKCKDVSGWLKQCKEWRDKYPNVTPEHFKDVNPYSVSRIISDEAKEGDIIIPDCGGNLAWVMQAWQFKKDQRLINDLGNSAMGWSVPAGIGAYYATGKAPICISGDGGMQINIQELQTVANKSIPLKMFVYSNQGYGIIRQFQDLYLGGRHVATREGTPDFAKLANAYGIKGVRVEDHVRENVRYAMDYDGPILLDIVMNPDTAIQPRAIFGKPIEEQHPYLPDEETEKNLMVKRWHA
jgi:acetolactate synthase I/II/III large subunit